MGQVGTSVPSSKRVAKKARPQPKMKEAPSNEGAFLVSATPSIRKAPGVGTGDGGGVVNEGRESPNLGQSGLIHEHRKMVISGITGCDG